MPRKKNKGMAKKGAVKSESKSRPAAVSATATATTITDYFPASPKHLDERECIRTTNVVEKSEKTDNSLGVLTPESTPEKVKVHPIPASTALVPSGDVCTVTSSTASTAVTADPLTSVITSTKKTVDSKKANKKNTVPTNHLVTEFFPIRRSDRTSSKQHKKTEADELRQKILSACEDNLKVVTVDGKGRGIVAEKSLKRGDFVVEYAGDLIDQGEASRREEMYSKDAALGCYMYYFTFKNKQYCIDATAESGRLGRLLNHSKQGNCVTRLIEVSGLPRLIITAAQDIVEGEELLYDYGDRRKASLTVHPWLKS